MTRRKDGRPRSLGARLAAAFIADEPSELYVPSRLDVLDGVAEATTDVGWGRVFARFIYPSPDIPNAEELQRAYAEGWDAAARRAEARHE